MEQAKRELEDFLQSHATREGVIPTGVPGLCVYQTLTGTACRSVVYKPILMTVLQGAKKIDLGQTSIICRPGQILAIGFDAVLEAEILDSSPDHPFRALTLDLDVALLQEVSHLMESAPPSSNDRIEGMFPLSDTPRIWTCLERLVSLIRTPQAIPVLQGAIQRELAYHLLSGPQGGSFARLSAPHSHTRLLAEAVRKIQTHLAKPLRVPELAASVGMSPSLFHAEFKELTSYSPIQFQKRLRLLEARRLMVSEGVHAGEASYQVGYRSPSQFSREYARLFGAPPRQDALSAPTRSNAHGALAGMR